MTVRPRSTTTALSKEQRQEMYGDYHKNDTEWAGLSKNISKVLSHRKAWAEDSSYRYAISMRGGCRESASNCQLGDWSDTCIDANSEPPAFPIITGRAKAVTECANIWNDVRERGLTMEDDDYIIARQACMKVFFPQYEILSIGTLRNKFYGPEVALAKRTKIITEQVLDEERIPSASASSGQPPPADKGAKKGKGKGKHKDKNTGKRTGA